VRSGRCQERRRFGRLILRTTHLIPVIGHPARKLRGLPVIAGRSLLSYRTVLPMVMSYHGRDMSQKYIASLKRSGGLGMVFTGGTGFRFQIPHRGSRWPVDFWIASDLQTVAG